MDLLEPINVRAGVALHLLDSDPEQAREALGAIKLASSEALGEVRLGHREEAESGDRRVILHSRCLTENAVDFACNLVRAFE